MDSINEMTIFKSFIRDKNTFKLPDIFAPARIPVTDGKKIPKTFWNVSPSENCGPKLLFITSPK